MIELIKVGRYYSNAKFTNIKPTEKYERLYIALVLIAVVLAFMVAGTNDYQTMIAQ